MEASELRRNKIDGPAGRLAWMSAAIAILAGFTASSQEVHQTTDESLSENVSGNETDPAAPEAEKKQTTLPDTEADSSEPLTLESLQRQIDTLNKNHEQIINQLNEATSTDGSLGSRFSFYGFMVFSLTRSWIQPDNAIKNIQHEPLSFAVSNVNLFFSTRMTQDLSALVELAFTFAPHGNERFSPYQRQDNTVLNTTFLRTQVLGGVAIERAQATWQKYDFLGVTIGRFITPWGIWNVDHSPVIYLPMVLPLSAVPTELLPKAQTGIMLHGRAFPLPSFYIDYALTVANNRADVEASLDFNDNKALGLRLALQYETPNLGLSLGGYGYFGQVNVITKAMSYDVAANSFNVGSSTTDKHTELTGTLDFAFRFWGLKLQAEYMRSLIQYEVHPFRVAPFFQTSFPSYMPDHVRSAAYVLLAYSFSLSERLGNSLITPWAMLEHSETEDTNPNGTANSFRGGLTFKPSPYWAIKAEGAMMWAPDSEYFSSNIYFAGLQAAVTF
jgi:hypothetical protein